MTALSTNNDIASSPTRFDVLIRQTMAIALETATNHKLPPGTTAFDVLILGRGSGGTNHPGNQVWNKLIEETLDEWDRADNKESKQAIALKIVTAITRASGRFLKKDRTQSDRLFEITNEEAVELTSQRFRNIKTAKKKQLREALQSISKLVTDSSINSQYVTFQDKLQGILASPALEAAMSKLLRFELDSTIGMVTTSIPSNVASNVIDTHQEHSTDENNHHQHHHNHQVDGAIGMPQIETHAVNHRRTNPDYRNHDDERTVRSSGSLSGSLASFMIELYHEALTVPSSSNNEGVSNDDVQLVNNNADSNNTSSIGQSTTASIIKAGLSFEDQSRMGDFKFVINKQIGEGSYTGTMLLDKAHGAGVMYYDANHPKKTMACGSWRYGNLDGQGCIYDKNGDTCYATFENGLKHGAAVCNYSKKNSKYVGHYFQDKKHGKGIFTDSKAGKVYNGDFSRGSFDGKGIVTDAEGNEKIGHFSKWRLIKLILHQRKRSIKQSTSNDHDHDGDNNQNEMKPPAKKLKITN